MHSIRIQPELREQVQAALQEDESLSGFVEAAICQAVRQRRLHGMFKSPGLRQLARVGDLALVDPIDPPPHAAAAAHQQRTQ
jgi:hypothetical protein